MKKLILATCLVIISNSAFAGCEINIASNWWLDFDRHTEVMRVENYDEPQALSMMRQDVKAGKAVWLEVGTKIEKMIVIPRNDEVTIIYTKDKGPLIGGLNTIKCKKTSD